MNFLRGADLNSSSKKRTDCSVDRHAMQCVVPQNAVRCIVSQRVYLCVCVGVGREGETMATTEDSLGSGPVAEAAILPGESRPLFIWLAEPLPSH